MPVELLQELHKLRPVTPEAADALADRLNVRRGDVADVVTAYAYLRLPHDVVRVCTGPLCSCLGARDVLARAQELETAPVVETPCLGLCDLAPASMRGEHVVGGVAYTANDGPSTGLLHVDDTLADFLARGGAAPLPPRERVLAELEASGLRGLGGAGFPTATKWRAVIAAGGDPVVVVNADEGEPGTFKDRYLLERRPHLVLRGLQIAMDTIGAHEAFVYVREEYGYARERLERALDEMLLPAKIVVGAGSYICGEETALLESMEGRRPMPRLRPPFPAQSGYLGRPTLVQNVETLAHLPAIVRNGGAWFAAQGRPRLFSISGCVARPGCYEAPAETTIRTLIEDYAGGETEAIGAVVPGGAAAGILPAHALDVPCGGSGALQVFPASYPVLRLLEDTLRFFAEESCQKCTPCRLGTRGALGFVRGEVPMTRERLLRWLDAMERGSICGLGQAAPKPVRDVLEHWPEVLSWPS